MVHTIQGKQVGNIGCGLMGLSMHGKKMEDDQVFAVIKAAIDSGCNYLNAGEFYGPPNYNTLTLLKKYYEKYPEDIDKVVVNVKGCTFENFRPDGSPEGIKISIGNCVKYIGGKGRIDQFEPARKDPKTDIEVTMNELKKYVESGDIGGIALSEVSAATIRRAAKVVKVEAVEVELSLWSIDPLENGVAKACAELGIPILAYSPLGHGVLTGQVKSLADLPPHDFRRMLPRFQPDVFEKNLRLVREVEKLAAEKGCTPGQIAINWLVALGRRPDKPTIIPIPGASSPERVRENSVEVELTEDDMIRLYKIIKDLQPEGTRYHGPGMDLLDNSTE